MKKVGRLWVRSPQQFDIPHDAHDYNQIAFFIKKIRKMVDKEFCCVTQWSHVQELLSTIDTVNALLVQWNGKIVY